jgi:hypothetical protein
MRSLMVKKTLPHYLKTIRWIARIWSILVTLFFLLIFFTPDDGGTGSIARVDISFTQHDRIGSPGIINCLALGASGCILHDRHADYPRACLDFIKR